MAFRPSLFCFLGISAAALTLLIFKLKKTSKKRPPLTDGLINTALQMTSFQSPWFLLEQAKKHGPVFKVKRMFFLIIHCMWCALLRTEALFLYLVACFAFRGSAVCDNGSNNNPHFVGWRWLEGNQGEREVQFLQSFQICYGRLVQPVSRS